MSMGMSMAVQIEVERPEPDFGQGAFGVGDDVTADVGQGEGGSCCREAG